MPVLVASYLTAMLPANLLGANLVTLDFARPFRYRETSDKARRSPLVRWEHTTSPERPCITASPALNMSKRTSGEMMKPKRFRDDEVGGNSRALLFGSESP